MDTAAVSERAAVANTASSYSVFVGILLGFAVFAGLSHSTSDFSADELGLGLNTHATTARRSGNLLSGYGNHLPVLAERIRSERLAGRNPVLWMGASQLHAINHISPDDRLAVWWADQRAEERGSRISYTQISLPNAAMIELLECYKVLRSAKPKWLILGVTYDDLNETKIRPKLAAQLAKISDKESPDRHSTESPEDKGLAEESSQQAVERTATRDTPQEWLEDAIVSRLESIWPAYGERHRLRAAAIAKWTMALNTALYKVRGRSTHTVDSARKTKSHAALVELLTLARADGVKILVYKPPHRPGESRFYHVRKSYDAYHLELESTCAEHEAAYIDLETIVPTELWGLTNNHLPDVFHFRGEGHVALGVAIDTWLENDGW